MDSLLSQFISKYKDQTGVGNNSQNVGQCVGLVSLWMDLLGVPHEYGNAKDLLVNANTQYFQVITNNTTNYPTSGDILVWGDTWGSGFGHTGICVSADVNSFTSFEQNDHTITDPTGACETLTHDYTGVLGWLHFTGTLPSQLNTTGLNTYGLDPANEASNQAVFTTWHDVTQGLYIPISQFNAQKQQIADLQKEFSDLQLTHNNDQREIVNLNSSLSALSTSNKDYASQALDAEKLANEYTEYMDDIANNLHLGDNGKTDAQLHQEIIKEIISLQENQKTEGAGNPQDAQNVWENGLKNIVNWLLDHGFKEFLLENNLHVVDEKGNFVDDQVSARIIAYLDDRFSRLLFLEKAIQATKAKAASIGQQVGKSRNFFAALKAIFVK